MLLQVHNARLTLRGPEGHAVRVLGNVDKGLDFCIMRGQHTVIVGENGAGKSTLLRLLRGELWLDAHAQGGSVLWHTAQGPEDAPLAGREIAALVSAAQQEQYVRQGWDMKGEDMLATGFADSPLLYTAPEATQRASVRRVAADLGITHLLSRAIDSLSQGQLRLLLLGRALVRRPALLLLDEFLDGLDATARTRVLEVLAKAAAHSTVVMTTHRAHSTPYWITRHLLLKGGVLEENTSTAGWLEEISSPQPATAPPLPAPWLVQGAPPLVELCNATVYLEREPVLHSVSWTWRQGEHWRIHGGNGAGKSTLLRLLAGEEYPALGGSIARYLPRHGGAVKDLESIKRGVRLVSDFLQAHYAYDVTGLELVLSGFDNVMGLYRSNTEEEQHEALRWMRFLKVPQLTSRRISTLSTGQMRRLLLARALVGTPDILLLDEPCSGLDSSSRRQLLNLLQDISTQGVHLALVSHHQDDALLAVRHHARMEQGHFFVDQNE